MFEVTVNTRRAIVGTKELITTSSAGIQCQFTFSEDWDELSKIAIFRNGDEGQEIPVALPNSNLVEVPAQSCYEEYVDEPIFVGVYGTDGLGAVIIPTVWVSLGVLRPGAVTTGIITPPQPTPDMWAQVLEIANNAAAIAAECEENEDQRNANEEYRNDNEEARVTKEENRAAAEAVREWMRNNFLRDGVSAETLAPESPATVRETTITDPETGAPTTGSLVFGIPKGAKGDPGATEAGGVTYDETEDYPAGSVGAEISGLTIEHNDLIRRNSANLLLGFGNFTDQTTGDQQWTWNKEHTTVTYSNTDPDIFGGGLQLYFDPRVLPAELIPGEIYQVEASGSLDATITFYFYTNGRQTSYVSLTSGWVTIPSDCNGLQINAAFQDASGVYTGTMTIAIVNGPSNQELSKSIAWLRSAVQQLNAGNVGYDESATYQAGSVGAELQEQNRQLSDKQDKTTYQTVSGTTLTLNPAVDNTMYLCGELTELTVTAPASGIFGIRFTSGTTPTVVTFTGITMPDDWPTTLDAITTYEINVLNGLGVWQSWI